MAQWVREDDGHETRALKTLNNMAGAEMVAIYS